MPSSIRRTARTLNLPSDASYRFERGVDPGMILPASQRATELMREIAGGNPAKDIAIAEELPTAAGRFIALPDDATSFSASLVPRARR